MNKIKSNICQSLKDHFRFGTLNFIFIIAYVNIFQAVFGPENSIVGVIFTIMMSASMARDLTATPVKHLLLQGFILVWMALAAYLVNTCSAPFSFLVNFITLAAILYAYTYEYSAHIYFPYILSYLFLIFISPVNAAQLPKRLLGMLAGAVSIMLYQWIMGRKRVAETARDVLTEMIDDIRSYISRRQQGCEDGPEFDSMRHRLCRLSRTVYDRRKKILCVSDAGFSMISAGRGLENLLFLLHKLPKDTSSSQQDLLTDIDRRLAAFRVFLQGQGQQTQHSANLPDIQTELPSLEPSSLPSIGNDKAFTAIYKTIGYIRDRLLHMIDPQSRNLFRQTALSLKVRLQTALDLSTVRIVYAFRVALLLSCATWLVFAFKLPHGKWFLFTLASVSLPYADDIPLKIRKRILATIMGGLLSVVIYALVPSAAGRTAAMMLSGYISFYFKDYTQTFACSTIGALGGAVFMDVFGFQAVAGIFLIRLGYILAGALTGYIVNCLIFPYSRAKATGQLWKKYQAVTELLAKVCHVGQADPQLYYHLVILAYMYEETLNSNATENDWIEFPQLLSQCCEKVRHAHLNATVSNS